MKNILGKIEFHYTYLIMAVGLVLTGHFVNLLVFTSLIIVHEFGHYITARWYHYEIQKIIIYPYGGMTKIKKMVNTKIEKDIVVAISGILMQSIYFLFIYFLYSKGIVREYVYDLFLLYHKSMFIFNLLPIVPLDGSKVVNLVLSKYFNFNLANNMTAFISLIVILLFLISNTYERNYSLLMTIGVLLQSIYKFYKDIAYVYNKFLLERYLYRFCYSKKKMVKDKNNMYKNREHLFYIDGKIVKEKDYLRTFFDKKR